MPYGLRNADESFQRYMDTIFHDLDFAYDYIDDILVASATPEEHIEHLRIVLKRLADANLCVNPEKCKFGVDSLDFLGHHVDQHGIRPIGTNIEAIRMFPQPTSHRKLRQFIGLVNFYRRFVPACAAPLHQLLTHNKKKSAPLVWTEEAAAASTLYPAHPHQ